MPDFAIPWDLIRLVIAKLKRLKVKIPLIKDVLELLKILRSPKVPNHIKAMIVGALLYFVLTPDLIPDFLGPVGFVDDAAVVAATIVHVYKVLKKLM